MSSQHFANPWPHVLIVIVALVCATVLAWHHNLNDAFIGIAGAAIGTAGSALAVQRHTGQMVQTLQQMANGATNGNGEKRQP